MENFHEAVDGLVSRIEPKNTIGSLVNKTNIGMLMLATTPLVEGGENGGFTLPPIDKYTGIGLAIAVGGLALGSLFKGKRGHNPLSYVANKAGWIATIGTAAWYGIRFTGANF